MKKSSITTLLVLSILTTIGQSIKPVKLKPIHHYNMHIAEPSDVSITSDGTVYVVSDNGLLYETDHNGKTVKQIPLKGIDFEGVYANDTAVFVVEELSRKVYVLSRPDYAVSQVRTIAYHGARNKGFESICYNQDRGVFLMCTEKEPVTLYELDKEFKIIKEIPFKKISDVSSLTWYDHKLYMLSDEDRTISVFDANSYKKEKVFQLNILNPEGIAFDNDGKVIITGDDLQQWFVYDLLNK